jgi:hypothetical protein
MSENSTTVTLGTPIPYGDKTLAEITLRRPKAGDLRGIKLARLEEVDIDTITTLVPRIAITPVSPAQLAELDPADLVELAAAVVGFFAPATAPASPSPTTPAKRGAS